MCLNADEFGLPPESQSVCIPSSYTFPDTQAIYDFIKAICPAGDVPVYQHWFTTAGCPADHYRFVTRCCDVEPYQTTLDCEDPGAPSNLAVPPCLGAFDYSGCEPMSDYLGAPMIPGDFTLSGPYWTCDHCYTCEVNDYYYSATKVCCQACDPDLCWCERTGACVACPEMDCAGQVGWVWDPTTCEYVFFDAPVCPEGQCFDYSICACRDGDDCAGDDDDKPRGRYPWVARDTYGMIGMVYESGRRIKFRRTDVHEPPYTTIGFVTDADPDTDVEHRYPVWADTGRSSYTCLFAKVGTASSDGVYVARSASDGASWEVEEDAVIPGASHPRIVRDTNAGVIMFCGTKDGKIVGVVQAEGDPSPSAEFTFVDQDTVDIAVTDGEYSLTAGEGITAWVLAVRDGGEIDTYLSEDNGRTWTLVA